MGLWSACELRDDVTILPHHERMLKTVSLELRSGPCDKASTRFSSNQFWEINRGDGKVKLFGTNYCLDAGRSPADGVGLQVWTW